MSGETRELIKKKIKAKEVAEPSTEVLALTVPDLGPSDLPYLLAYTPEDLCIDYQ